MIETKESVLGFHGFSNVRRSAKRSGITFDVTAAYRIGLAAIVANRGSPQKHVWRAEIILMSEDGLGTVAIMAATGKSQTCVWRWQERFMAERVDGLLRDKSRPPIAPLDPELVDQLVVLTLETPRQEALHWDCVRWARHRDRGLFGRQDLARARLAPHRWRSFKLSSDKALAEKLHDVVGLCVCPPAHAIMPLSCPSMKEPDPGAGPDTAGTPVKEGSWWRDDDP